MKISIITVTWNRADLLKQAIESVLAQNDSHFEHVIVDNASTDGTVELLKSYRHLKWVSEPDSGQSNAMNKGLKMATGDVFGWLNSDDLYPDNTFKVIRRNFTENNPSFVYGTCQIIGAAGQTLGFSNFHKFDRNRLRLGHNNINTPAVFADLKLTKKIDGVDENLNATFDLDLWIRLSEMREPVAIRERTSLLRLHDDSGLMSQKNHLAEKAYIRRKHGKKAPLVYRLLFDPYFLLRHWLFDIIKMRRYGVLMNNGSVRS